MLGTSYENLTARERTILATINESSGKLGAMFMDTLASVQFQDVTRQQIEQVIGGIERLDSHAESLAGVLEAASMSAARTPSSRSANRSSRCSRTTSWTSSATRTRRRWRAPRGRPPRQRMAQRRPAPAAQTVEQRRTVLNHPAGQDQP
jgi:hypothetical protein